jgi:predicted PurR-regulated permease PerM
MTACAARLHPAPSAAWNPRPGPRFAMVMTDTRPFDRRRLSLVVLGAVFAVLLVTVPDVLLVIFAGILLAVFLRWGGCALAGLLHINPRWGVGLFLFLLLAAFVLLGLFAAPSVSDQLNRLATRLPEAWDNLRQRVEASDWSRSIYRAISPDPGASPMGAVSATLGVFGNLVVMLFIGIYGAFDPEPYRNGLIALVAPSLRPKAEQIVDASTMQLRGWLTARLFSMTVVGVLTTTGLWLMDVPLALILGLIAGLSGFVPNLGPVLSAVPAIALALAGDASVWLVVALYVGVQTIESYLLTPLVEAREVSLPPALILSMQLLMGTLFGLIGVALASPLAAVLLVVVHRGYIKGVIEDQPPSRI